MSHVIMIIIVSFIIIKNFVMKRNMGNFDRVFRILVAAVIVALYFTHAVTGTWAIVFLIAGAVFLLTGFVSFCPLYALFGIDTNAEDKKASA